MEKIDNGIYIVMEDKIFVVEEAPTNFCDIEIKIKDGAVVHATCKNSLKHRQIDRENWKIQTA